MSELSAARLDVAAVASLLLVSSLAGCSIPGLFSGGGGSSSRSTAVSDDLQGVTSAVLAADPRVTDASGTVSYSGTLAVIMSGEEKIIDLRDAIAGLPKDVTRVDAPVPPLWDGGVTLSRVDLDKLEPVS